MGWDAIVELLSHLVMYGSLSQIKRITTPGLLKHSNMYLIIVSTQVCTTLNTHPQHISSLILLLFAARALSQCHPTKLWSTVIQNP